MESILNVLSFETQTLFKIRAMKRIIFLFPVVLHLGCAGNPDPIQPDSKPPKAEKGWRLVWNDEFNRDGIPDSRNSNY
jgi:hypothetical protein